MDVSANVSCPRGETVGPLRSLFGRPSSRCYRAAVAQIVRDVKARHALTNERFAEVVGCAEQTIANAENESGDLTAVILLSIAYAFGEEAIQPVRQLYLCAPAEPVSAAKRLERAQQEIRAALADMEAGE